MYLVFDVETTGLPLSYTAPITDLENWPRVVQLSWQLHGAQGNLLEQFDYIIKPDGFEIPVASSDIHGITTARARAHGKPLKGALAIFAKAVSKSTHLVGHNLSFDLPIIQAEYLRAQLDNPFAEGKRVELDTMKASTTFMNLPSRKRGGGPRYPRLEELHARLRSGMSIARAHNAAYDVEATAYCLFALAAKGILSASSLHKATDPQSLSYEAPSFVGDAYDTSASVGMEAQDTKNEEDSTRETKSPQKEELPKGTQPYVHLHVHSQFSVLPGLMRPEDIVNCAKDADMKSVAMTDHGNMYGTFSFVKAARAVGIKPIIGLECFVSHAMAQKKFTRENPDKRFRQLFIAKNKTGYMHLMHLSSVGHCEGLYGLYPRINMDLIESRKSGLIALSGGAQGAIGSTLLNEGEAKAETLLLYWKTLFQNDFYLTLYKQGSLYEEELNAAYLRWSKKHSISVIAAHEVYYARPDEGDLQDTLVCIRAGAKKSDPVADGRGKPIQLAKKAYDFASSGQIYGRFSALPSAYEESIRLADKVDDYEIGTKTVSLPVTNVPQGHDSPETYLRHLVYEGAKERYGGGELAKEVKERLELELKVIEKSGFAGYFLIVNEIIKQAHKMGMATGPGRGSVAGSVIAYTLGISALDPLRYGLLFERFLNPDRLSLPDIDIDFQDEGRDALLQWIVQRYGKSNVAQIATYGTLAMKSALRDCARVMELPLDQTNELVGMLPSKATSLAEAYRRDADLGAISQSQDLKGQVLRQARRIEGSLRNIGTHACGVIISPVALQDRVPLALSRDAALPITQYDNNTVEAAGLLKMDILGLRTLSILQRARKHIDERHHKQIEWEKLPLDDAKTYGLYQRGETYGIFQFESPGMQRYLRELKPTRLDDLIAMNALYRPGPMEYIPSFIRRRHGHETIRYDLPEMEDYLKDTYGITVYQEQVMLLSQRLAGFTGGMADTLRKAMGKKDRSLLDKLQAQFIKGFLHDHPEREQKVGEKIWRDWEAFAKYAFNKSHAACYALLSYWTAYVKANYPAEFMAALLSYNFQSTDRLATTIEECRRMRLAIKLPCVNTSGVHFHIDKDNAIRFGLSAIKGIGEGLAVALCDERAEGGSYTNALDLAGRHPKGALAKDAWEALAQAGALDNLDRFHRRQYLEDDPDGSPSIIKQLLRRSGYSDAQRNQSHLFLIKGDKKAHEAAWGLSAPQLNPYTDMEQNKMEKEKIGTYLSSHPLNTYQSFLKHLSPWSLLESDANKPLNQSFKWGGILTDMREKQTKNGTKYTTLRLEGLASAHEFLLWQETMDAFANHLKPNAMLCIEGSFYQDKNGRKRLKVQHIAPLAHLINTQTQSLILHLSIEHLTQEWSKKLEILLSKSPKGNQKISLSIGEKKQNEPILVNINKYLIALNDELIKGLQALPHTHLVFEMK